MPQGNLNDLWFTPDGDYLISETGDLRGTDEAMANEPLAGQRQLIYHRLVTEKNGWSLHPNLSAGLEQFIGASVDEELLVRIQSAVKSPIVADLAFRDDQVDTRAMDLGQGTVAILIWVRTVGDNAPIISFAFDVQTGSVSQVV